MAEPILIASHVTVDYRVFAQRHGQPGVRRMLAQVMGRRQTIHAVKDVSFRVDDKPGIGEVVVWGMHDGTLAQARNFKPAMAKGLWMGTALVGIDQVLDMGRTAVNVMGNCAATVVVARWEGELDDTAMRTFGPAGEQA